MIRDESNDHALIDAYFEGWNAHDARAVARTFAPGGTYTSPTTEGPVPGSDIDQVLQPLCVAFPDLRFERSLSSGASGRIAVEWVLTGHNRGALRPEIQPTGKVVDVRGVDVFEVEDSGLRAVRSYFDQKAFVESFGLMALVQPVEQGPASFGYAMRVPSGNHRPPGVVALTWIQGADEGEKERIRAHSRQNVRDFLAEPGFISIVTGFTGLRGFTVTAWEDEASLKRALGKHHSVAMKELSASGSSRPSGRASGRRCASTGSGFAARRADRSRTSPTTTGPAGSAERPCPSDRRSGDWGERVFRHLHVASPLNS